MKQQDRKLSISIAVCHYCPWWEVNSSCVLCNRSDRLSAPSSSRFPAGGKQGSLIICNVSGFSKPTCSYEAGGGIFSLPSFTQSKAAPSKKSTSTHQTGRGKKRISGMALRGSNENKSVKFTEGLHHWSSKE